MREWSDQQLENFIFEEPDLKRRVRRIGYFLTEHIQYGLADYRVSIDLELRDDGDINVRGERSLPQGFSLVFFTASRKAWQLETKEDVVMWVHELIDLINVRYRQMPPVPVAV